MSVNSLGLGEALLSFLLSTGGMVFMGLLLLAAIVILFKSNDRKLRMVCTAVILCCAAYAALIVWMSIGFGMSGHRGRMIQG